MSTTTHGDTGRGPTTGTATSADGTRIAYTREGAGPALVMVHCVGISRATTMQPTLRSALAATHTVFEYDRRAKGASGGEAIAGEDVLARELEDLAAVIEAAGDAADVYGFSSGATLALHAGLAGLPIRHLTVLEPPLMPDDDGALLATVQRILADEGNAAAHAWFTKEVVGVPDEVTAQMPPPSDADVASAPTLQHELSFLPGSTAERFADLTTPTLVIASESTAPFILECADALAAASDAVTAQRVPGEWHGVDDATLVRTIDAFLDARRGEA